MHIEIFERPSEMRTRLLWCYPSSEMPWHKEDLIQIKDEYTDDLFIVLEIRYELDCTNLRNEDPKLRAQVFVRRFDPEE